MRPVHTVFVLVQWKRRKYSTVIISDFKCSFLTGANTSCLYFKHKSLSYINNDFASSLTTNYIYQQCIHMNE